MITTANISASINLAQSLTANTAGSLREAVFDGQQPVYSFTNGIGSGQADTLWSTNAILTGSTSFNLSSLTGAAGALSFARVKIFCLWNQANTEGNSITVGGATTNPWTGYMSGTEDVEAGGLVLRVAPLATGWLVPTAATLQLSTTGTSVPYRLVLLGCSA